MIWIFSAIWFGMISILIFNIVNPENSVGDSLFAALEAFWVYALSFMVVWQQQIFRPARQVMADERALDETTKDETAKPAALGGGAARGGGDEKEEGRRYQRSSLDEERVRRITGKIERAMNVDRLYRNQGITLRHLSDHTRVSENHLSEVLNNHMGRNFYEFINHWRVRDACALLAEADVPIIAIGEEVGFNSRSTFNTAFKKETGLTPSEYRSSLPVS
jgi:AraC-like DNA-binding protein